MLFNRCTYEYFQVLLGILEFTLLPDSQVDESDLCNAMGQVVLFPVQFVANLHSVPSLHSAEPAAANSHFSVQHGPSLGLKAKLKRRKTRTF